MKQYFKLKYLVNGFLLICVLSINHIIIYNEELLVCISFFLFVAFVAHYFGNQIKESLDASSKDIQEICENLTNSKQQYLQQLSTLFHKTGKHKTQCKMLKKGTQEQLLNKTNLTSLLWSYFHQQWLQKSSTLSESKHSLQPTLLNHTARNQLDLVLTRWGKFGVKSAKLDKQLLDSVIGALGNPAAITQKR